MNRDSRVLVIEDSIMLIRPLCRMVMEQGFTPVPATSLGAVRTELAKNCRFMAALADYHLPDAERGEVIPLLLDTNIPTIVLTAMNDSATRERIIKMPVVDYIPKESPSSFEYVMKMLKRVDLNPGIKILIVTSDPSSSRFLKNQLTRHLYQVIQVSTPEDALSTLRNEKNIQLALIEHHSPGLDGIRLTSTIRRFIDHTRLAIVGISAHQDTTMTAHFLKAGADDYLQKPFHYEEFFCRITRNIEFVENLQALKHSASIDPLSGLSNRRSFFERALNLKSGFSLAILDIDHFKKVNDYYGHLAGDDVIAKTARLIESHFPQDMVARFGGEEFVVLAENTPHSTMQARMEALRADIANSVTQTERGELKYTISAGVASADRPDVQELLKVADRNLYYAKEHGRNQVRG